MHERGISLARLDRGTGDRFQTLRREVGVESFGINLIVLQPGQRGRIHAHEHQEEVYLVLEGQLTLLIEGAEHLLGTDHLARVEPAERRQLVNAGSSRLVVLALGGTGGHAGRDGRAWNSWEEQGPGRTPQEVPLPDDTTPQAPTDGPSGIFERACQLDSTGHSDLAVPLYREALELGLSDYHRRRATIQLGSSLRNLGRSRESVTLLRAELESAPTFLSDAVRAFLALALVDTGRAREGAALALGALAPHLPRYQRSLASYAEELLDKRDMDSDRIKRVRAAFGAYESGDRSVIEGLLSDDLTFYSPADVGIDRERYFERCWPNAGTIVRFEFERLVEIGDEVFVTYECTRADGRRFRNTEVMTFDGEKICKVEVYFGWDVP